MVGLQLAKVAGNHEVPEFRNGAGHLDTRRAAADDDAGQQRLFLFGIVGKFCFLESKQQALADQPGFVNGFQAWGPGPPVVVTELIVFRTGGDHEPIVGDLVSVIELHRFRRSIDAGHFRQHDLDIAVASEGTADRF